MKTFMWCAISILVKCHVSYADDDMDDWEHMDYDPGCVLPSETERLQIAFVVDNTGTNADFIKYLSKSLKEMMNQLNAIHDGTEFALTLHASWPQSAFTRHEKPEACYKREINFTSNINTIIKIAEGVRSIQGPSTGADEENGVAALAFTATDKKLGWVEEDFDEHNRKVHRIMVFITDVWSLFTLPKPGKRTEFRGDGTDTCATSLPPSLEKLRQILSATDTNIIGIYLTSSAYKDNRDGFKKAGFGNRHYAKDFSSVKGKEEQFRKAVSSYVVDRVKRLLRCVFEEPIPYNTLGL